MTPDATKQIAYRDYLALLGLEVLGKQAVKEQDRIEDAMRAIVGESDRMGHMGDVLFGSRGLDDALRILGVEVLPPADSEIKP